jgi:hypothetical protein
MTDHPRRGDDPVCRVADGNEQAGFDRTNAWRATTKPMSMILHSTTLEGV